MSGSSWGLSMNLKKCAVMRFQRRFHAPLRPNYFLEDKMLPWTHSHTDLGVTVDDDLKFHGQARSAARKAGGVAHNFLRATLCREPDFMIHVLRTHIRPVLEYASVVWNTGFVEDTKRLEAVQRLWTRHVKDLKDKTYEERLTSLNLYSIKGRLLRADLIKCWKIFRGCCPIQPADLWDVATNQRTRGNMFKIKTRRCQLDTRARFFSERVVSEWNSLPNQVVSSVSIAEFKTSLAEALGSRLFEYDA